MIPSARMVRIAKGMGTISQPPAALPSAHTLWGVKRFDEVVSAWLPNRVLLYARLILVPCERLLASH